MIKNQRQYAITVKQVKPFQEAVARMDLEKCPDGVDPIIFRAQIEGMKSQLQTLYREISEYEALKAGRIDTINLSSLGDLPRGLIKARIARGMSHKDLAVKMGIAQQQVQRWESEDYENVTFSNLSEVASALDIDVSECIRLPAKPRPALTALKELGLSKSFIKARLLPKYVMQHFASEREISDGELLAAIGNRLSAIFGCVVQPDGAIAQNDDYFSIAVANGRFKLPSNADPIRVQAYAAYATYLAKIVASASSNLVKTEIPRDWKALRKVLCGDDKPTFSRVLEGAWALGIPVLPLMDPIRFHGFCCRIEGRNVVVLKQSNRQASRWTFDLIHEIYHAGESPLAVEFDANSCDSTDAQRRESEDEVSANELAGAILLDGRADELYKKVLRASEAAGGPVHLKRFASQVAEQEGVEIGHLANYIAFRLRADLFVDWWGVAATLQPQGDDPVDVARACFLSRLDFSVLSDDDADLLKQSISEPTI